MSQLIIHKSTALGVTEFQILNSVLKHFISQMNYDLKSHQTDNCHFFLYCTVKFYWPGVLSCSTLHLMWREKDAYVFMITGLPGAYPIGQMLRDGGHPEQHVNPHKTGNFNMPADCFWTVGKKKTVQYVKQGVDLNPQPRRCQVLLLP